MLLDGFTFKTWQVFFLLLLPFNAAHCETIMPSFGIAVKQANAVGYVPEREILPSVQLRFNRQFAGKWNFCTASTFVFDPANERTTSLAGIAVGASYDTERWMTHTSEQDKMGSHEITVKPNWHYRLSALGGAWWYSDTLVPTDRSNLRAGAAGYPVAGALFGIQGSATVTRFISNRFSVSTTLESILPLGNFSVGFYTASIGFGVWYE